MVERKDELKLVVLGLVTLPNLSECLYRRSSIDWLMLLQPYAKLLGGGVGVTQFLFREHSGEL